MAGSTKKLLPGLVRLLNPKNKGHLITQPPYHQHMVLEQQKLKGQLIQKKRDHAHALKRSAHWTLLVGDRVRVRFRGDQHQPSREIVADVKACNRHTGHVVVGGCPDPTLKRGELPEPGAGVMSPMTVPYADCTLLWRVGPEVTYQSLVDPITGLTKKVRLNAQGELMTRYNRLKLRQQHEAGKGSTPKAIVEQRSFWLSEDRPFPASLSLLDNTLPLWKQKGIKGGILSIKKF